MTRESPAQPVHRRFGVRFATFAPQSKVAGKPHIAQIDGVWVCGGVYSTTGISRYSARDAYGHWHLLNLPDIVKARIRKEKGEQPCTTQT